MNEGNRVDAATRKAMLESFMDNHERAHFWANRPRHGYVDPEVKDPYRTVGIIGGGTAGFLCALAMKARLPHLDVTLVESTDIPIIGVGEATAPHIVPFLHQFCDIDVHEFYREVRPTWKLGIKFVWGPKEISHFQAPFDWDTNNIGGLGSLKYDGNLNAMTIESLLMEHNVTPIVAHEGGYASLLRYIPFGYHLENRRLVKYLHKVAAAKGIKHLDRKITDIVVTPDGQEIDHLVTHKGEKLKYDLFIDCTGFRSLLLGKALKTPFKSFASTLYNDRALTFSTPHEGKIKPYTTATTMNSGWEWTIPHEEQDNHGYVFSSKYCTNEEAEREVRARWPNMSDVNDVVHFRSGRHEEAWRGNVIGIGNAGAFVEPLESTGLFMISITIQKLCGLFPQSKSDPGPRVLFNSFIANKWDGLRWFLGIHFKYNPKLDTPYWQEVRANTDVSGAEHLVQAHKDFAPMTARTNEMMQLILECSDVSVFFHLGGWDNILLGNGVPARRMELTEPREDWERRKRAGMDFVAKAVDHPTALRLVRENPEFLDEVRAKDGWSRMMFPGAAL